MLAASVVALTACGANDNGGAASSGAPSESAAASPSSSGAASPSGSEEASPPASDASPPASDEPSASAPSASSGSSGTKTDVPGKSSDSSGDDPADIATVAEPESVTVLVNKQNKLPDDYDPSDLVYPDVRFTFTEKIEKREMRKVAADALEKLFAAADKDDVPLAGVSAYRSFARQKSLFEAYVKKDGLEKARTYSAYPGTSEHETGLAIDVSGSDGKCAATDCFAGTKEAKWLAEHSYEYGFIIRYPEGKEDITGYKYEPWHLRYVGLDAAKEMHDKDVTLEEYTNALAVSGSAGG
ncbi:M15 family metallopeptidase [Cohnella sp. CBP 2801]|uniref:M15 family metallopeptidase n=2 Tax=Cohnella zeiphila TaxID=2761120 RepID=A0A7X0ST51_9BACL|nr:M15 family metallopeptidase [Cohnella zeiphila]